MIISDQRHWYEIHNELYNIGHVTPPGACEAMEGKSKHDVNVVNPASNGTSPHLVKRYLSIVDRLSFGSIGVLMQSEAS